MNLGLFDTGDVLTNREWRKVCPRRHDSIAWVSATDFHLAQIVSEPAGFSAFKIWGILDSQKHPSVGYMHPWRGPSYHQYAMFVKSVVLSEADSSMQLTICCRWFLFQLSVKFMISNLMVDNACEFIQVTIGTNQLNFCRTTGRGPVLAICFSRNWNADIINSMMFEVWREENGERNLANIWSWLQSFIYSCCVW